MNTTEKYIEKLEEMIKLLLSKSESDIESIKRYSILESELSQLKSDIQEEMHTCQHCGCETMQQDHNCFANPSYSENGIKPKIKKEEQSKPDLKTKNNENNRKIRI